MKDWCKLIEVTPLLVSFGWSVTNAWSFVTLYLFYLPGLINTFPLPGETKTDREQTSVAKLRVKALSAMTDHCTGPSSSVSWLKKLSVFYFTCNLIKWPWEFKLVLHYLVFPAEWPTFETLCQMTRGLDDVSCPGGKGESGRPSRYTPDKMSRRGGTREIFG